MYSNYVVNDNIIEEESNNDIEKESREETLDNFMNTDEYQTFLFDNIEDLRATLSTFFCTKIGFFLG